jgi:hypothetical protein
MKNEGGKSSLRVGLSLMKNCFALQNKLEKLIKEIPEQSGGISTSIFHF